MNPGVLDDWAHHEFCHLTTVGRVTGRPHTIEIWFVVDDGVVWLLTEPDGATDWVRNLRRSPDVRLRIGSHDVTAIARVDPLPTTSPIRSRLADRYRHTEDGLDAWCASALTVRVTPID